MGNTNQWLSDNIKSKTDLDSSFGLYLLKTGGTIAGNLTTDASLIIKGFNDVSTFYVTIDNTGKLLTNNIT